MQASRLPEAIARGTESTCDDHDANVLAVTRPISVDRVLRRRRCTTSEALLDASVTGSGKTSVAGNCSGGRGGEGSFSSDAKRRRPSETKRSGGTLVRRRRRPADSEQPDEWQQKEKSPSITVGRSDTPQQSPRAPTAPTIVITPAKEWTRQVSATASATVTERATAAALANGDLLKPPTVSLDDGNLAVILSRSTAAGTTAF